VRSTARLFGRRQKLAISLFYAGAIALFGLALAMVGAGVLAFGALTLAAAHMAWIVAGLKPGDPANCLARFRANSTTGWILFVGLVLAAALRV
jgi:4-hydroxybenzoate polyprenyltransferase